MATVTLAESAKLTQDMLISGIIESVITINPIFDMMPFQGINGNAVNYDRENTLGDVQALGVGGTITANNPATFTSVTSALTTLIGDADVNNLINSTRSDSGNDQTGVQISSKSKNLGRSYQNLLINGTGASNEFLGLSGLCASDQMYDTGVNGGPLTFPILDELLSLVTAKDGEVDFIMMHRRTLNSYKELCRNLGGTGMSDVIRTPEGRDVISYWNVPIYRNDWLPINQVKGSGSNQTTIYAGCWDDGSMTNGLAGLTAMEDAGISLVDVGELETRDEHRWRLRWYCGLALYSSRALACADGITN